MKEVKDDERLIRRFLLGELKAEEYEHVEERFIVDGEYQERVLMAEDDLIEDYLDDALSEEERQRFGVHFLSTTRQRRKLRIAESTKKYVAAEMAARSATPVALPVQLDSSRRSYKRLSLRNPLISVPLAAALLLVIGLSVMKLIEFRRASDLLAQEKNRISAIERELAQLNQQSVEPPPSQGVRAFSVILSPVFVRDVDAAARFSPPPDAASVELRLLLARGEYQNYRAVLQKVGTANRFAISNLRAVDTGGDKAVLVKLPTHLLTRGDYHLTLSGDNADGKAEEVGEYNFQITAR